MFEQRYFVNICCRFDQSTENSRNNAVETTYLLIVKAIVKQCPAMQGITRVTHVQGVGRHNLLFEKCNFSSLLIVFINEDKGACAPLSTDVREPQTATGSRMFSFLARF